MATTPIQSDRRSFLRGSVTIAGATVLLPSMGALSACGKTPPPSLQAQMPLIATISERILPASETGGAIAAGVPDFIGAVYLQHFTAEQQSTFVEGLDLFAAQGMADASKEEQDAILTRFGEAELDSPERIIFQQMLDMTVFGYYTSEIGAQELAYEKIPGRYDGCLPLEEIGKAWLERGV